MAKICSYYYVTLSKIIKCYASAAFSYKVIEIKQTKMELK